MIKVLKLLKRILVHKFWVAYYCFQAGLYWQGLTHDLSKFSRTEFSRSIKYWDDINYPDLSNYQILLPDAGAKERYSYLDCYNPITCSKVRDLATGKITDIKIDNPESITDKPIVILDDLCDGGRTFVEIAKAVRAIKPNVELSIFVNHMVNPKGIENLSKNFNHVWFTNSYKDWQNEILPNNVKVIEVV